MILKRDRELGVVRGLLKRHPVVGITGARQVGKTTLARMIASGPSGSGPVHFFDLEDPADLARLQDPMLALRELDGLVIIDEIQRAPDLFATLRVLADRADRRAGFLVLGSSSPELLRQGSETLAGRIVYHQLGGFAIDEVGPENAERLWIRGGFPRSYLAANTAASHEWRSGFIKTFLERDLPQFGSRVASSTMRRFWNMLAHYHGQVFNASEFGRSFGVADTTVRSYLDLLSSMLVVRIILPWHENISKRQVRKPKIFIADSGLLHALLNLRGKTEIEGHPKVGASWEGFALAQAVLKLGAEPEECFFWATHSGAELDLLVVRGSLKIGVEFKRTSSPKATRSMKTAMEDLKLKMIYVIHPGKETFPMAEGIRAVSFDRLLLDLEPLE